MNPTNPTNSITSLDSTNSINPFLNLSINSISFHITKAVIKENLAHILRKRILEYFKEK